jgi:hypothetical protein
MDPGSILQQMKTVVINAQENIFLAFHVGTSGEIINWLLS